MREAEEGESEAAKRKATGSRDWAGERGQPEDIMPYAYITHSRIRISAASSYAFQSRAVGKNQKYDILTGRITRWGLVSCTCLLYEQRQRSIRPVGKGLNTG